jgi:hypothetical protein
VLPSM